MKQHCFYVPLVFLVLAVSAASATRLGGGLNVGGWSPIKDLKDPHVVKIANYAITEYNNQSKAHIVLKSIVKGEQQVVSGTNYRLVLEVDGGDSKNYEAVVWENAGESSKNLISFKPVN